MTKEGASITYLGRIFNIKEYENCFKFSGKIASKTKDGRWITEWLNFLLVNRKGKSKLIKDYLCALEVAPAEKGRVFMVTADMSISEYQGKQSFTYFVNEFSTETPIETPISDDDIPF